MRTKFHIYVFIILPIIFLGAETLRHTHNIYIVRNCINIAYIFSYVFGLFILNKFAHIITVQLYYSEKSRDWSYKQLQQTRRQLCGLELKDIIMQ